MLRIRADQMAVFAREAARRFEAALPAVIRAEHRDLVAAWSDDVLRRRVSQGLARARALDIHSEAGVHCFIGLAIRYGPLFERHPQVQAVLAEAAYVEGDVGPTLRARLPLRVWEELRILAGADPWRRVDEAGDSTGPES